jgi:proline iminopeptidase
MSIEFHYITHQMFMSPNEILDNIDGLRKARIPTLIIHGVDDHIVSIKVARELAQALPEAQLVELPDTGHSLSEPKVLSALVAATKIFAGK